IFYCVRDYRRGTLPRYIADDPQTLAWIKEMAEELPIRADSKYEDIQVYISADLASAYWRKRTSTANFLKHADRDVSESLSLDDVHNLELLLLASSSYNDLIKDTLGTEGLVLWLYYCAETGTVETMPARFQETASKLAAMGPI